MYSPALFHITNPAEVDTFITEHNFGALITTDERNIPTASHIPFDWEIGSDGKRTLYCHVSKANPLWKSISEKPTALCIVQGHHTYISPTWYSHENVPTWNYMSAHIYGKPSVTHDEQELLAMVSRLTKKFEQGNAYAIQNHSSEYLQKQLRGIVGISLEVEKIETTFKLSQNRKEEDFTSVIRHLQQSERPEAQRIALEMKNIQANLFNK